MYTEECLNFSGLDFEIELLTKKGQHLGVYLPQGTAGDLPEPFLHKRM